MPSNIRSIQMKLRGKVQGVGLRFFLLGNARGLGVDGWVCNNSDGTVSCHAQGDITSIDMFIKAAKEGRHSAIIEGIEITETTVDASLSGFEVRTC